MKVSIFDSFPLIDLHTHTQKHADRSEVVEIVSSTERLGNGVYSLERHPWNVDHVFDANEQIALKSILEDSNCLALGEIGLDKLEGVGFSEQLVILRSLLSVATDVQKPVILHCVKAFSEIIQFKKEFPSIPNWVIHGFNKNPELAKQLLDHGFYLSVNPQKSAFSETLLKSIPIDRLFLETDNSPFLIEDNYLRAVELLGIEMEELKRSIARNAKHFFGHE